MLFVKLIIVYIPFQLANRENSRRAGAFRSVVHSLAYVTIMAFLQGVISIWLHSLQAGVMFKIGTRSSPS